MKNQNANKTSAFWLKAAKIIFTTAICTIAAYLICTYLVTPEYQTEARFTVGWNHLPDEYYDCLIEEKPMDLVSELEDYVKGEETYALAGEYAGVPVDKIRSCVNVVNEKGTELLIISSHAEDAQLARNIANSYARALDDVLYASLEKAAESDPYIFVERSCTVVEAPLPDVPSSPRTALITLITGVASAVLSFIVFSRMKLFDSINVLVFLIFTLLCIFPFYYLFINTISDNTLVARGAIKFYPEGIHFQNYINLQNDAENKIGNALFVTVARTIIGTGIMVLVSAWAGYLVTKKKMWKRSFWYRALVITMYFNAGLIPWFMNMDMLGLKGNFLAYILPGMVAPYNIILVKTYIESIPSSLEESAVIDGAGTTRVFFSIIWPLSIPILATIAIFGAVGNWNSFQDSLLLMTEKPEMYTLQHYLYNEITTTTASAAAMSTATSNSGMNASNLTSSKVIKYTVSMVTIIPILLVYPIMQRFFVKGIMLGAVKG